MSAPERLPPRYDSAELESVSVRCARQELDKAIRVIGYLRGVLPDDRRGRYESVLGDLVACEEKLAELARQLEGA